VAVHELDILRVGTGPAKAQPILIVDANAPTPGAIALQPFEAIARRNAKILETSCKVELFQFAERRPLHAGKPGDTIQIEQRPRIGTRKGLD
jgi:hypothetical protein